MVTLMSYHSSGGESGRCDAKCYNGQAEKCECICGGANHAAGLEQALDNCRELAEGWIARAEEQGQHVDVARLVWQQPLFPVADLAP